MSKQKILIVDDEEVNRELLKILLEEKYEIMLSSNGYEALKIVDKFDVDLILLDVVMPDMDGFEVSSSIRKNSKTEDISIIFATSDESKSIVSKCFEFGGDDYISKPINTEELLARVKHHLENRTLKKNLLEAKETAVHQTIQYEEMVSMSEMCSFTCKNTTSGTIEGDKEFKKMFGIDVGVKTIDDFATEFIRPEYQESFFKQRDKYLSNTDYEKNREFVIELGMFNKDKQPIETVLKCKLFIDESGNIYRRVLIRDITSIKNLQKNINTKATELELLIDSIPDGAWIWNLAENTLFVSTRWKEIIGFSDNEFQSDDPSIFFSRVHPDDIEKLNKAVEQHIKDDTQPYEATFRMKHKNGDYVWIKARGRVYKNSFGEPVRFFGIHQSLQAEYIAKESYEQIFNSVSEAIFIQDAQDGTIIDVNDSVCDLLGYTKDELVGSSISNITLDDPHFNGTMAQFKMSEARIKKKTFFEWKFSTKSGETLWLDIHLKATKILGRECLVAACIDITSKKESDRIAHQLTQIVEQSSDAIIVLKSNGKIEYANPISEKLFGIKKDDVIDKELHQLDLIKRDDIDLTNSIKNNKIYRNTLLCRKADGCDFWCEFYSTPLIDVNDIIGYTVIIRDVNESIKLNEQLKKTMQEQEKTIEKEVLKNREKDSLLLQQGRFAAMGEMINMIAHQWRQPLNAVTAASIALKMRQDLDMLDEKYLDQQVDFIQNQVHGMSQTIDDFMSFFKPKNKKELFSILDAAKKVQNMMHAQLKSRSIDLHIDIDKDVKIKSVKNEFEHILLNLIANSRDAFEENEIETKQISITAKSVEDNVIVEVEDTAGGIPSTVIHKIFDPYFTTKEQGKGTGIGLYMTKNIIEKHFNGSISVENTDKGAHFTIELPKSEE